MTCAKMLVKLFPTLAGAIKNAMLALYSFLSMHSLSISPLDHLHSLLSALLGIRTILNPASFATIQSISFPIFPLNFGPMSHFHLELNLFLNDFSFPFFELKSDIE